MSQLVETLAINTDFLTIVRGTLTLLFGLNIKYLYFALLPPVRGATVVNEQVCPLSSHYYGT